KNEVPNVLPSVAPPPPPGAAPTAPSVSSAPPAPVAPPEPPARPEPVIRTATVPSGTLIPLRMIDSVDSKTDRGGQTFKASITEDVQVNGETVIRKGNNAYVKLTQVQQAGNIRGQSQLQLQLDRLILDSGSYKAESNVYETQGAAQGQKTARNVGIG